jgi:hypothetical protein
VRTRSVLAALALVAIVLVAGGGCDGSASTFQYQVTPPDRTVALGGSAVYSLRVQSKTNINSEVMWRVTGLPSGATSDFSPQTLPSTATTATLTIQTTTATPVGTYTIHIFVMEAGQTEIENTRQLTVASSGSAPDFTLEVDPAEASLSLEGGRTFTFFVRPLNDFSGDVAITVTGLSDDLMIVSGPNPTTVGVNKDGHSGAGGTFVLRVVPVPPIATPVTITVTATSGAISHSRTIPITIPN